MVQQQTCLLTYFPQLDVLCLGCCRRERRVRGSRHSDGRRIRLDRATFTVSGKNAYGMLRAEHGVHRLVRISPTDEAQAAADAMDFTTKLKDKGKKYWEKVDKAAKKK